MNKLKKLNLKIIILNMFLILTIITIIKTMLIQGKIIF
jgi:hypothetical protein